MTIGSRIVLAAVFSAVPAAAFAADAGQNPKALQQVLDCRALTSDPARLACYDTNVAQLGAARARGDVTVIDREQVRDTRKKLFGFTLPALAIFGDDGRESGKGDGDRKRDRDAVEEITAKVRSASRNRDGGWIVTLEDGARWEQTGTLTFGRDPGPGSVATIRRAALGSFKMSFDGGPAVKAKRIG